MTGLVKSRITAWLALAIVIALLVLTFNMRGAWWEYIDIFFAFLMTFTHLLAVYFQKLTGISRQLDMTALVCGLLMIISLIVEFFLM